MLNIIIKPHENKYAIFYYISSLKNGNSSDINKLNNSFIISVIKNKKLIFVLI